MKILVATVLTPFGSLFSDSAAPGDSSAGDCPSPWRCIPSCSIWPYGSLHICTASLVWPNNSSRVYWNRWLLRFFAYPSQSCLSFFSQFIIFIFIQLRNPEDMVRSTPLWYVSGWKWCRKCKNHNFKFSQCIYEIWISYCIKMKL